MCTVKISLNMAEGSGDHTEKAKSSGGTGPGPTRAWARASENFLNDIHNNNNYYYYCS